MSDHKQAPPLLPADPYTEHRWHWVQGNEPECWEWVRGSMWMRPGVLKWKSADQAGSEGWTYLGEAHPPKVQP